MKRLFIVTASWESRFLEGARRSLEKYDCSDVLCFWFSEFAERTAEARGEFKEQFGHFRLRFEELRLLPGARGADDDSPGLEAGVWRQIFLALNETTVDVDEFVFDITTTPRETLWVVLDLLTNKGMRGNVVYHRAAAHGAWCAAEPERPHIVPKLGGISGLDCPSKLLVVSGYDTDRVEHFVAHFEPDETAVMLQEGWPDEDLDKNQRRHEERLRNVDGLKLYKMNSYGDDWGYSSLEAVAITLAARSNLVLASVGPKTSAVALYRIHRLIENSALVYSACREYNEEYSNGIGDSLWMAWEPGELEAYWDSNAVKLDDSGG
jgi:hypothetical protein